MDIDLAKQRSRTIATISKYYARYHYSDKTEQLIISSSLLNIIWNTWCLFWKNYWICHIRGGIYFDKQKVIGIHSQLGYNQACAYASSLRGNRPNQNYTIGDSIPHYKEPTWGDYKIIENIATNISSRYPMLSIRMHYILGILPVYKDELNDFQTIRNSFIHLNHGSIKSLENLRPFYIFPENENILNILNVSRIGDTQPCFPSLTDNMIGFLKNLREA